MHLSVCSFNLYNDCLWELIIISTYKKKKSKKNLFFFCLVSIYTIKLIVARDALKFFTPETLSVLTSDL